MTESSRTLFSRWDKLYVTMEELVLNSMQNTNCQKNGEGQPNFCLCGIRVFLGTTDLEIFLGEVAHSRPF